MNIKHEEVSQLVERFRDGDTQAGWKLVESQRGWLIQLSSVATTPRHTEDLVSELSIELFKALKNYDPARSKLSTFTRTVYVRRVMRILDRLISREQCNQELLDDQTADSEACMSDCVLEELRETMQLSDAQKHAFLLHVRGKTQRQIANSIAVRFPGHFDNIRSCDYRTHVSGLIDGAKDLLRERLAL